LNPAVVAILSIFAATALPIVLWALLRRAWLARQEREVLRMKYGDLEMFADRLREWKVLVGDSKRLKD